MAMHGELRRLMGGGLGNHNFLHEAADHYDERLHRLGIEVLCHVKENDRHDLLHGFRIKLGA
ncbi:hypothetical protein [uncultured Agrobacterium sp.]|uniref:hypothetical protein n=1 Tax=uncultured Agrobacterium sp. TaxID=157277 RepID=UPI0025CEF833|nr:hypothetical protein [uncultured Agrobacterium sp.]